SQIEFHFDPPSLGVLLRPVVSFRLPARTTYSDSPESSHPVRFAPNRPGESRLRWGITVNETYKFSSVSNAGRSSTDLTSLILRRANESINSPANLLTNHLRSAPTEFAIRARYSPESLFRSAHASKSVSGGIQ